MFSAGRARNYHRKEVNAMNYVKPEITELGSAPMLIQGTKSINLDAPGQLAVPCDCEFED
jgi:hypothetical protein